MNTEPDAVDVEGLVKALEKVLGLQLTAHQYLLARDVAWAFTDGRHADRKPNAARRTPACKCPTQPTTLLDSMRKGVIAIHFIGSCALPTKGDH